MESALADIVLLGSPVQVRLAHDVMTDMGRDQKADMTPLLEDLRRHLRQELGLEPEDSKYQFLRIRTPADENADSEARALGLSLRSAVPDEPGRTQP
jgi:hypothetical protein